MRDERSDARQPTAPGPRKGDAGWLVLSDDDLVFRIESLPADHDHDEDLLAVVRSSRHFFVRQEAAKRIRDAERLKAFAGDRHIGQILVRQMRRDSDVAYLEQLLGESSNGSGDLCIVDGISAAGPGHGFLLRKIIELHHFSLGVGFADSEEAIHNATVGFIGQSGTHQPWLFLT